SGHAELPLLPVVEYAGYVLDASGSVLTGRRRHGQERGARKGDANREWISQMFHFIPPFRTQPTSPRLDCALLHIVGARVRNRVADEERLGRQTVQKLSVCFFVSSWMQKSGPDYGERVPCGRHPVALYSRAQWKLDA